MNSILRVLVRAPEPASTPLFSRYFSVYHAVHEKGDYVRLREKDPEAYRQKLDKHNAYTARRRSEDPVAYRRLLDSRAEARQKWLQDPANHAKELERSRFHHAVNRGKERVVFLVSMTDWSRRSAWFGDLPWKSHRPVYYNKRVEHYCEGCKWTVKGGRKLWWKQIQSSSTADADSWLCNSCYVPQTNCREAMPRGYEDLTTFKDIAKRRDELGHGA
ncbi:hypothetical protein M436DRAFT_75753 [Aureobasidium namibiae CBS 147.97]|uniref:Uncharacterized protein n=1 Tax=Aureobasidium namibiae CBS 147.97 TaxID=1043004 RepID=A0A074WJK6_9PEZI|nr:uncharacterized protein M436DRAFT_75753 [Aureobasidium namibiae CBS 147.97]KEQ70012.1 hypothetical protein M436DRAFT_75753 [Aureobasidium namibiae CBS 147.97]